MSTADSIQNKDEILANFQAVTGIEDVAKAFTFLDSANWDLIEAVNKAMPEQHRRDSESSMISDHSSPISSFPSNFSASLVEQADVLGIDSRTEEMPSIFTSNAFEKKNTPPTVTDPINIASSSNTNSQVLDINIQILSDGVTDGNSFPLELPGLTTVGELQTLLHQLVGIPPCNQFLEGFTRPVDSETVITKDLLPKNMSLSLNTSSLTYNQSQKHNGSLSDELVLLILDEKNGKDYGLTYPATKLVKDIKGDISQLTGIPVRDQIWTGWPAEMDDSATLASLGISSYHNLKVNQATPIPAERTSKTVNKLVTASSSKGDASEESSADEFEDASELLPEEDFLVMCDDQTSQSSQPLIPPNVQNEITGVLSFVEKFQARFGTCVPLFFYGTLEDALNESVMLPAKNRKPLVVYLHHDKSVFANVFCSQSLCQISVVDYLTSNFVIWGWDLTHQSNKARLLKLVLNHFGAKAHNTVRSYNLDKLPALLIINRNRGSLKIASVVHGNAILDEVMTRLLHFIDVFEEQRRAEAFEDSEREMREAMKAEQDAAYHASLEADRAKAQAKRKAELEEQVEKQRQQSIKEQEDALKEAVRASLESELPQEPGVDCTEATTHFRFRVPKGEPFSRTFTCSTPLQTVLNFLCVKGFPPDEYKYIQSWPRRCITTLDARKTLDELKIHHQETINVEERTE